MANYLALDAECFQYSNQPIMQAIVKTESSFNPFAIGVVNGRLDRQPRNKEEAIATALALKEKGFNYSMGLAQVNQVNLGKYGLTHETVFDPCRNVQVGSLIFNDCKDRAVKQYGQTPEATNAALSCYYSGNFVRGQQREGKSPSYVERVFNNLRSHNQFTQFNTANQAIHITAIGSKQTRVASKSKDSELKDVKQLAVADTTDRKEQILTSWDVFHDF